MGRHKLIEDDLLLAKVREIVVTEGITVSSRKIADTIGISSSVLFQRFGSKTELLFAAMTPLAPDMSAILGSDLREGHVLAQLEGIAWELLEYFRKLIPVLMPLATDPSFDFDTFRKRHPNSPLERLTIELMRVFEEKRQKGEIDCPDVGPIVSTLVSVAYGFAMFERIGVHTGAFTKATVRDLTRLIWRGIAPAGQREPLLEGEN